MSARAVSKNSAREILTERELEYLSLVAMGFKNKEIAVILSVTKSTVKKTLEKVFQKTFAKDRTSAVTIAFVHNLLNMHTLNKINKKYNLKKSEIF